MGKKLNVINNKGEITDSVETTGNPNKENHIHMNLINNNEKKNSLPTIH
jgi:hypothetical protein